MKKERITDFSKAKVGDRVFDRFRQEWGKIVEVYPLKNDYPISVEFKGGSTEDYTINGMEWDCYKIPGLVWAEQKPEDDWSVLPEMPKRMVKKKIEGWINIYPSRAMGGLCKTRNHAISRRMDNHLGEPLFISHEYEIEED